MPRQPGRVGGGGGAWSRGAACGRVVWRGLVLSRRVAWSGWCGVVWRDAHPLSPSQRLLAESGRRRRGGGMHSARGRGFDAGAWIRRWGVDSAPSTSARLGAPAMTARHPCCVAESIVLRRIHPSPPSPPAGGELCGGFGGEEWIRGAVARAGSGGAASGASGAGGASEAGRGGRGKRDELVRRAHAERSETREESIGSRDVGGPPADDPATCDTPNPILTLLLAPQHLLH